MWRLPILEINSSVSSIRKKISYRKHVHHNASRCWAKRKWLHVLWHKPFPEVRTNRVESMKTYVRSYGRTIVQPNFFGLMVTTISYSYGATLCELRYKYSKKNEFEVMKDGFIIMTQWCSGNPLIIVMQHFYQKLHMSPAVRFSEMAHLTSSDFQRINFSLKNLVISKFLDCF